MPYYPVAPADPCWALFDHEGLQIAFTENDGSGRTPDELEVEAFRQVNANRDNESVYIVRCLWTDSNDHRTFYEVGDRVTAPTGSDEDRVPPE
jgi:hypothetical protein